MIGKRPNLKGCPICGSLERATVSGFTQCRKCGHNYGSGGLGNQSLRRNTDGELYNVADDRGRLPDADSQTRSPKRFLKIYEQ